LLRYIEIWQIVPKRNGRKEVEAVLARIHCPMAAYSVKADPSHAGQKSLLKHTRLTRRTRRQVNLCKALRYIDWRRVRQVRRVYPELFYTTLHPILFCGMESGLAVDPEGFPIATWLASGLWKDSFLNIAPVFVLILRAATHIHVNERST
jgi:hypothetical protein